jgi:hypothetical protein
MAYYIFLKSLRSQEEFRKNPRVKIPPKSTSTNFQILAIIKNQIFIRKRIFLHFRPIRPSGQPAYSTSRPTPPPGLRSIARPSWPAQGSRLPPHDVAPLSSAPSRRRVKMPWLPQPPPRPPLFMADRYPSLILAIIEIYSRYFLPPFNPRRRPFPNSPPRCSAPSPPAPIKGEHQPRTSPHLPS